MARTEVTSRPRRSEGSARLPRTEGNVRFRRRMGIVCYVLAGLMLVAALVVPVVGFIATFVLSVAAKAADGTTWTMAGGMTADGMTMAGPGHDIAGVLLELAAQLVLWLLDLLGPIPAILVALLTVIVEIGLILSAIILIVIGRRLRRPARIR